jgi:hypothetical protein
MQSTTHVYKEPHSICAASVMVLNLLVLLIYFDLNRSYSYYLILSSFLFWLVLYYILFYIFPRQGVTVKSLTWREWLYMSFAQKRSLSIKNMKNKYKWYAMASSFMAFLISVLILFNTPLIEKLGIWWALILVDIMQIALSFASFEGLKKFVYNTV